MERNIWYLFGEKTRRWYERRTDHSIERIPLDDLDELPEITVGQRKPTRRTL